MPTTEKLLASDGTALHVRYYSSSSADAPTMLIVHGACEHGGRYQHVAEELTSRGWNVVVPDLRGHGRSDGVRVHVRHFDEYVNDLNHVISHFDLNPQNTVMLGHSMGGLVSTRFAQSASENMAALILVSPLLRVKVSIPTTTLAMGKLFSFVLPRFRFRSAVEPEDVTRNEQVLQARKTDRFMEHSVTAGWFYSMKRAMRDAWSESSLLQLPVLVIQAGDDRVVDPHAPKEWLKMVASSERQLHVQQESYHELFHEPEWKQTIKTASDWLHNSTEIPRPFCTQFKTA